MSKYKIKNEDIALKHANKPEEYTFPKYTKQLINLANQNSQGTRPKNIGQLTDLFPEFRAESSDLSLEAWRNWYEERYPDTISQAIDKALAQLENFKKAIQLIDKEMVTAWVEDLVINKTYSGLYIQERILSYLADINDQDYRLATPVEESKGIDGYVGETPYSIKPTSYKSKSMLNESIDVNMIFYKKDKNGGITIDVDENDKIEE